MNIPSTDKLDGLGKECINCGLTWKTCHMKNGDEWVENCQKIEGKKHVFCIEPVTNINQLNHPENAQRTGDEGLVRSKFYEELEFYLDEYFPKGECKERGAALVVFAWANQIHDKIVNELKKNL